MTDIEKDLKHAEEEGCNACSYDSALGRGYRLAAEVRSLREQKKALEERIDFESPHLKRCAKRVTELEAKLEKVGATLKFVEHEEDKVLTERDEARKRVKELEIDHAHEEARHISACHREAMQAHDLLSETRKLVEAEKRVKELEAWKSAAIGQSAGWGGRKPAGP